MKNCKETTMRNDQESTDEEDFLALKLSPPVSSPQPLPQPELQPQPEIQSFPSMQALLYSQNPQLQQYQYQRQLPQNPPLITPAFVHAPPPLPPSQPVDDQPPARQSGRVGRTRRNQAHAFRPGKSEAVPVLFPWATSRRATVQTLDYLLSVKITKITGEVQCKKCERQFEIGYDLMEEFRKLWKFIADNKSEMKDRAPKEWENPEFPDCKFCDQKGCATPIVAEKKREINWLFLLLGRFLCCLTLDQLKYFCKHSRNHRTGAKNRVLYLTYLGLCKQLDPSGPFDALDV